MVNKQKLLDWLNEKYLSDSRNHEEAKPFNHVMLAIKSGKFDIKEVTPCENVTTAEIES